MPTRILRDWTDSEPVNSVSAHAERVFIRLIMKADDFGRMTGNPKLLRPLLFPLLLDEIREADLSRWIAECEKAGLVRLYDAQGKRFLEIANFRQRTRAMISKCPPPSDDRHMSDTCQTDDRHMTAETETETETETEALFPSASADGAPKGKTKKGKKPNDETPGFFDFWNAYPNGERKIGFELCRKFWSVERLEPVAGQVLEALKVAKKSRDWNKSSGEFIPFPYKWLELGPWKTDLADLTPSKTNNSEASKAAAEAEARLKASRALAQRKVAEGERSQNVARLAALPPDTLADLKRRCIEKAAPEFRARMEAADPLAGQMLTSLMIAELEVSHAPDG